MLFLRENNKIIQVVFNCDIKNKVFLIITLSLITNII